MELKKDIDQDLKVKERRMNSVKNHVCGVIRKIDSVGQRVRKKGVCVVYKGVPTTEVASSCVPFSTLAIPKSPSLTTPPLVRNIFCDNNY